MKQNSALLILEIFARIIKICTLVGGLDTRLLFYAVLKLSWYSLVFQVFRQLESQLVYTMFTSNNYALLHFCLKDNLVKYEKTSKYYENDGSSKYARVINILLVLNVPEVWIYLSWNTRKTFFKKIYEVPFPGI